MGKPITEAVYLRDIQRQCLAWQKEFMDDKNKGLARLVLHSTATRKQTESVDTDAGQKITKISSGLKNT